MKERIVDVATPDGLMEAFITHPSQDVPFPPVILYMDMWGVREELYDLARRFSTVGYYCIVPDLYYRWGKYRSSFKNEKGQMMSFQALDPAAQERQLAAMRRLGDAMVIEDTGALLEFMDRGEPVKPGPAGAVGYCMGGRHVLCVAGSFPGRLKAGASMHGTDLVNERPNSPHRIAKKAQGELYCGYAEHDKFSPPHIIRAVEEGLRGTNVRHFYEVHKGAHHGYALPDRDVFDKHASNRDWELMFAMLRRRVPFD